MDNIPHSWSVAVYPNYEKAGVDVRTLCTDGRKLTVTLTRDEAISFAIRTLLSVLETSRIPRERIDREGVE